MVAIVGAVEQLGEGFLVDADRRAGAVGVHQLDDQLGAAVVARPDRRGGDHRATRRHVGGSV